MSYAVTQRVWESSQASGEVLLVALALADFAMNGEGTGWPSARQLREMTRLDGGACGRALAELERLGEVVIDDHELGVVRFQFTEAFRA
ncbi:MAG: hypothetical protein ACJ76I_11985 [Gaiellaceae bacterium]